MATDRRKLLKMGGMAAAAALAGCVGVEEQGTPTSGSSGGSGGSGDSGGSGATQTTEPAVDPGTATTWYARSSAEGETLKGVIEEFNSQSRHTVEGSDLSDLEQKTQSAIPANQGPQIFEWAHDWVGDYYQRGFLSDQSGNLSVSMDTFTDAAAEAAQFDGAVVGLPFAAETVTLLYNEEYVDSPPESVSEMVDVMEEHHNPSNGTYGLGYPLNAYFMSGFAQAFGGYYFDPEADEMLGIANEETVEGFEYILDTFVPYMPNDTQYGPQAAAFSEGNAPFAINGPWYLGTAREKGVDVGVTSLPTADGSEPSPYTGIQLWYFAKGMGSSEADATAAREFVEWYVTNEEQLLANAESHGFIPVHEELAGDDDLPSSVQGFSQAVQQGVPMPTHPRMGDVWGPLETGFGKALNGNMSVNDAMVEAEETIRSNWE
ncbi:extracellular solute-binding protein [Halobaculum magnesiiphilum]|uniref:Extracellular solute-binding protein n=1 Tax=Halobaculum magnesiiphilum TaxID=1017351 RepID=A0A8T8WII3_9EURY|nr:extracellular solute-binding protein [Halobaculum magnesiiphilum]QZP39640.1 extracellular solute-binding protein [Halobaculum magnesiiphilum]